MGKNISALKTAATAVWQGFDYAAGGLGVILLAISHAGGKSDVPFENLAFLSIFCGLASACIRNLRLQALFKPRLKVACSPYVPGCRKLSADGQNCVYRIWVKNPGIKPVEKCEARLTAISRNADVLWDNDIALLTFTPSEREGSTLQTLRHNQPNWIDVLFLYRMSSAVNVGTKNHAWNYKPLSLIFTHPAEYTLKVSIASEVGPTIKMVLLFKWQGAFSDCDLSIQSVDPREAHEPKPSP